MREPNRTAVGLVGASLVTLAIVFAWVFTARAAEPPQHPCKEGLIEWLAKGDTSACFGHLVPTETWAFAQLAVDEATDLKKKIVLLEQQVTDLRVEVERVRANGEALLKISENARTAAELAKTPPKCSRPSLLERPEFSYPVSGVVGFVGGMLFNRYAIGCAVQP